MRSISHVEAAHASLRPVVVIWPSPRAFNFHFLKARYAGSPLRARASAAVRSVITAHVNLWHCKVQTVGMAEQASTHHLLDLTPPGFCQARLRDQPQALESSADHTFILNTSILAATGSPIWWLVQWRRWILQRRRTHSLSHRHNNKVGGRRVKHRVTLADVTCSTTEHCHAP